MVLKQNSNTTLVKVKYTDVQSYKNQNNYSNTTLVKVKFKTGVALIIGAIRFKYNTC